MKTARDRALELLSYIDGAPTAFHATRSTAELLKAAGFEELHEQDSWALSVGDKRYVTRNGSSIVAFVVGSAPPEDAGFVLVGAHTDSPALKLKPLAAVRRHGYRQLGVEPYGGVLLTTWLDRDLGLAGRVIIDRAGKDLASHLVHIGRPILRIPNIAIHLNRDVNTKGLLLDPQKHLPPILGLAMDGSDDGEALRALLCHTLSKDGVIVEPNEVADFDLALVDVQPSSLGGENEEFIWAPRIDNLASCHAALSALIEATEANSTFEATRCIAFWDNEECGSRSMQGAQGPFLRQVLGRVVQARAVSAEAVDRSFAHSYLVSVDMAHAIHPNYSDQHEPDHVPLLGKGPVIKKNANQAYASDGMSSARFARACRAAGCTPQRFVVRSDLPCGSTIGPITAALTGIETVDVGNPMLSMHSIREMAAVADHAVMISTLGRIFGADDAANMKRSGAAEPKGGTGTQTKSTKKKRSEKA